MLTLKVFGPMLGLPDPSPFCVKAEALLKMSGLSYQRTKGNSRQAPKSKLPVLIDDGVTIADSTLIRLHLEQKHGVDFDKGLTAAQKGEAWAFEKLCEDNLYWAIVRSRWDDDTNFDRGPRRFFDPIPAPVRALVIPLVRRKIRRDLFGQGFGRHSFPEMEAMAIRGFQALSDQLGEKPCLFGAEPCGADTTVFAWVCAVLCPIFETPIRTAVERMPNLVAYRDRGMARWYPGFDGTA